MRRWTVTAALAVGAMGLATACASLPGRAGAGPTTVHFTSRHREDVDVAVSCGEGRPAYLGRVPSKGEGAFTIPDSTARCVWGLRFWLLPEGHEREYLTDRIAVKEGAHVEFFIDRYAALSGWRVEEAPR